MHAVGVIQYSIDTWKSTLRSALMTWLVWP